MSIGTIAHAATEIIVLTEVEKEFQSYIVAQEKIQLAIEAATLEIHAIGLDKINQFTKDVAAAAKVDADRASAICKEIKTTEQKIVEKKEGPLCVLTHVKEYIRVFEETNCHAALRVWRKIRAEIVQSKTLWLICDFNQRRRWAPSAAGTTAVAARAGKPIPALPDWAAAAIAAAPNAAEHWPDSASVMSPTTMTTTALDNLGLGPRCRRPACAAVSVPRGSAGWVWRLRPESSWCRASWAAAWSNARPACPFGAIRE